MLKLRRRLYDMTKSNYCRDCVAAGCIFLLHWITVGSTQRYCIMQCDVLGHYSLGRTVTCNSAQRCSRQVGQCNNIPRHGVYLPVFFSCYSVHSVAVDLQTWDQREATESTKDYSLFSAKQEWGTAKVKAAE